MLGAAEGQPETRDGLLGTKSHRQGHSVSQESDADDSMAQENRCDDVHTRMSIMKIHYALKMLIKFT